MEKVRDEVIEMYHRLAAIEEKAACREVSCDVIDQIGKVQKEMFRLKEMVNEIIKQ